MGDVRMEPGKMTTDQWIGRIETALGRGVDGGARVAIREVLVDAFAHGLSYNGDPQDREEGTDKPATTPPSASEIADAYEARVSAPRSTEAKEDPEAADSVSALRGWWEQTAHDEVSQLVAKMTEYGGLSRATDLTEIGRDLVAAGVGKGPLLGSGAVQDGWLQELGIYFYVRGKFARWQAAIIEGRPVSDDTLLDIGIYVRMAQRVRAVGGWPV
uniref:Tail assembly chaperone n=1 Tax=Micrococcus phage Olihed TaxID=3092209 RepID=A0AAU6R618_9CAUD